MNVISDNAKIKNGYALGSASYGFSATSNIENFVENSYFNGQANSKWTPATMAKSTKDLKKKETFASWDFENVWIIEEGQTFPELRNAVSSVRDSEAVEISTVEGFNNIRNNLNGHYKLTKDIDLFGEDFIPIGTETAPFRGKLDGNGFKIENLSINVTTNNTGLFGYMIDSHIKDLVIENANVKGSQYTGILAGRNYGHIENTKVSGSVEGTNHYTGGLAGFNGGGKRIEGSFSEGMVKGNSYTGGLAGWNEGDITKSYSTSNVETGHYVANYFGGLVGYISEGNVSKSHASGNVKGTYSGGFAGAIVGYSEVKESYAVGSVNGSYASGFAGIINENSKITDCYSTGNTEGGGSSGFAYQIAGNVKIKNSYSTSIASYGFSSSSNVENFVENSYFNGQANSKWTPATMAKSVSDLKKQETYALWDFENIWNIDENQAYPELRNAVSSTIESEIVEIGTAEEFNNIRKNLNGNYKLTKDIDLSLENFTPIGTEAAPFRGKLDGNGFKIENLSINVTTNNTGLFGYMIDSHIKDVVIEKANVKGSQYTGILAGRNYGYIENAKVSGNVEGTNNYTGGLAGLNGGDKKIEGSFSEGMVKGGSYTGGLIGINEGDITKSYSISNVETGYYAANYFGGLVGYISEGNITESYASGNVSGNYSGGFSGTIAGNVLISDCYSEGNVTGSNSSGFVSIVSGNAKIKNSYALGSASYGFSATSNIENFVENSYFNGQANSKWTPTIMAKKVNELKKQETFINWDFENIWIIEEGKNFPELKNAVSHIRDSEIVEISTAEELNGIRNNLNRNYKLTKDIDLFGENFTPIGTEAAPFRGTLDGNGFKIENLSINVTTNNTGLFGYMIDSHIKDVVIEKANVKGSQYTGILAGRNYGHIENAKVSGTVEGTSHYTGGLAGFNGGGKRIEGSFSEGMVKGNSYTGGLVGQNEGDITKSYSTSNVETGHYVANYFGGLVGYISEGNITESYAKGNVNGSNSGGFAGRITGDSEIADCYATGNIIGSKSSSFVNVISDNAKIKNGYALGSASYGFSATSNIENFVENSYFNGQANSKWTPATMAKSTKDLKKKETFASWDFENVWIIEEGQTFPELRNAVSSVRDSEAVEISTVEGFNNIRNNLNGHYKLTKDIDLFGEDFIPIGTETAPFRGKLDGNGFKIENLSINVTTNNTGLFGYMIDSHIKDLVIENANVKGSQYTGILAGRNYGHIENTKVSGSVEGTNHYTGGLAGFNGGGKRIEGSFSEGTVKGNSYTGGLAGWNEGDITKSYSTSNVETGHYVANYFGGLVGYISEGNVSKSHASGNVKGTYSGGFAGAIVGYSEVKESYAVGSVNGSYASGFAGIINENSKITDCYSTGNTEGGGSSGFAYQIAGNVKIKNSYSTSIASYGFSSSSNVDVHIENSYFNGEASNKWTPATMAKTTAELKDPLTFIGWDFESIWLIKEGEYPKLRMEEEKDPEEPEEPEEPEIPLGDLKLQAEALNLKIKLSWDDSSESNLLGYNLFRVENEKEVLLTTVKKDGAKEYLDDNLKGELEYKYILEAVYKGGAKKRDNVSKTPINVDDVKPTANSGEDFVVYLGEEAFFDGSLSKDNVGVVKYSWDIEGAFKEGNKVAHTFEALGSHLVTLTVVDGAGNTGTDQLKVEVVEKSTKEPLVIRVLQKGNGNAVSNAYVWVNHDGSGKNFLANSSGQLTVYSGAGDYEISAYKEGYTPNVIGFYHEGTSVKNVSLELKKDEIISGAIEVERLTIEKIIEKGIDIEDPDNQFVYEFEVVGIFEAVEKEEEKEELPPLVIIQSGGGGGYISGGGSGGGGGSSWSGGGGSYSYTGKTETVKVEVVEVPGHPELPPSIAIIRIPAKITFLKDFFEVSISLHNSAPEQFVIENASVDLNVPLGLSIVSGGSKVSLGNIAGMKSGVGTYIIRGDIEGSYDISANLRGTLMPFEAPISKELKGSNPVRVVGGEGLTVYVQMQDRGYKDADYFAIFTLVNDSDVVRNNVKMTLGKSENRVEGSQLKVIDIASGKEEVLEDQVVTYELNSVKDASSIPYFRDGDTLNVRTLGPNEHMTAIYVTEFPGTMEDATYHLKELFYTENGNNNVSIEVELSILPYDQFCVLLEGIKKCGINGIDTSGYLRSQVNGEDLIGHDTPLNIKNNSGYNTRNVKKDVAPKARTFSLLDQVEIYAEEEKDAPLGEGGWFTNYDVNIEKDQSGMLRLYHTRDDYISFLHEDQKAGIAYGKVLEDGRIELTAGREEGEYFSLAPGYVKHKLTKNGEGYELRDAGPNTYCFNNEGVLIKIKDKDGKYTKISKEGSSIKIKDEAKDVEVILTYDGEGRVASAETDEGRKGSISYNENNQLEEVITYRNETIKYFYDEKNRVIQIKVDKGTVNYEYDDKNRITKEIDSLGNGTVFEYLEGEFIGETIIKTTDKNGIVSYTHTNFTGGIIKTVDSKGNELKYIYDSKGNLENATDGKGNVHRVKYNDKNQISSVKEADGAFVNFVYDDKGNKVRESLNERIYVENTYNEDNLITRVKDERGVEINYAYDSNGNIIKKEVEGLYEEIYTYNSNNRLVSEKNQAGVESKFYYDNKDNLIKVEDNKSGITKFTYDEKNRLTESEDSKGEIKRYSRDERGNVIGIIDRLGNETHVLYDELNRVLETTDPLGEKTGYTYDNESYILSITGSDGKKTEYIYDEKYNVVGIKDNGVLTAYEYNEMRQVTKTILPNGATLENTWDQHGLLKNSKNAAGGISSYSYDDFNALVKSIDPSGNVTTYEWDNSGNQVSSQDSNGNTHRKEWDKFGRLVKSTDPKGNESTYLYGEDGNLKKTIDPLLNETIYSYDELDRLKEVADSKGNKTTYEWDELSRLIGTIDPLGSKSEFEFDANSNLIKTKDALLNEISYEFDPLGRTKSLTDPLGYTSGFRYEDSSSRVLESANAKNNIKKFSYDNMGNLIKSEDEEGNFVEYSWDNMGNITSFENQEGGVISYEWDQSGRLVKETGVYLEEKKYSWDSSNRLSEFENGRGMKVSYSYGKGGELTSMDEDIYTFDENYNQISAENEEGTVRRTFDELDRLTKYEDVDGRTISYEWDELSNLTAVVYPDGERVEYEHDALSRLIKVRDYKGRVTSYEWDEIGRLTKESKPDGTVESFTYDASSRLIEKKVVVKGVEKVFAYEYDELGNMVGEDLGEAGLEKSISNTLNEHHITYTPGNRIDTWDNEKVVYDEDGNMVRGPLKGQMTDYVFNKYNQLTSVGDSSYFYDASGARIRHEKNGAVTSYVHDPNGYLSRLLLKGNPDGSETIYVYGNGLISEEVKENGAYSGYRVHHYDFRGSTVFMTDEQGSVTSEYSYTPYGELVTRTGNDDTIFLYVGKLGVETDDNGLIFMRARYYNTDTKSFINVDPIADGNNWYSYAGGNPISFIDPSGLKASLIGSKEWVGAFNKRAEDREYATSEDWKAFLPGVWDGVVERNARMLETGKFEELLNCITWGYTDFLKQQYLLTIENPTEYNVANLASLGIVGMINSAVNPEKTGSPEQVMSIVGIAALGKGAQAGIAGKGGTAAITTKTVVKGPVKPKIKGSVSVLDDGLGTYGNQGGHHPMAKKAFEGVNGYNPNLAITISKAKLDSFGVKHTAITGQQNSLYTAYAKTGQPLTMDAMRQIEINAMTNVGVPLDYATNAVNKAIADLIKSGVNNPINIPWN